MGSRSCTSYGRQQTKRLVYELAELVPDVFVISGLARGIDTVAHEAALEAGLRTIAVLAGGLQHIYPPENQNLADRICQQGALISEFPLATKPVSHNFPIRKRVISGISQGVLMTEASVKSGALITATFGKEQNREVFAVPGRIDSHPSSGCNHDFKEPSDTNNLCHGHSRRSTALYLESGWDSTLFPRTIQTSSASPQ